MRVQVARVSFSFALKAIRRWRYFISQRQSNCLKILWRKRNPISFDALFSKFFQVTHNQIKSPVYTSLKKCNKNLYKVVRAASSLTRSLNKSAIDDGISLQKARKPVCSNAICIRLSILCKHRVAILIYRIHISIQRNTNRII